MNYFDELYSTNFDAEAAAFRSEKIFNSFATKRSRRSQHYLQPISGVSTNIVGNSNYNDMMLVGSAPVDSYERFKRPSNSIFMQQAFGEPIKDRMLVLESILHLEEDDESESGSDMGVEDSNDDLDFNAIYSDFEKEFGQTANIFSSPAEELSCAYDAGSVISIHPSTVDTEYNDFDQHSDDSMSSNSADAWTEQDSKRHYRLFRIISDWIAMLKVFSGKNS